MQVNRQRVRQLRQAKGWSQEHLAQVSGLHLRTIQRLEAGGNMSNESLHALAAVFEVPAETLLMPTASTSVSTEQPSADPNLMELGSKELGSKEPGSAEPGSDKTASPLQLIKQGFVAGLDFTSTASRPEFWWFALAVCLLLALAKLLGGFFGPLLGPLLGQLVGLLLLVPWLAACTRRLRDAGINPWWQLCCFIPVVGGLGLLWLLSFPSKLVTKPPVAEGEASTANV